jgi:hypothetical protein
MAEYSTLLYRVQAAEFMDGQPLVVSSEEWERLERLNKLRRTFAHFNPQGWSIELRLLLLLMPLALNAIEHLLTTQHRVLVHLTDSEKARIKKSLSNTRQALKSFEPEERPLEGG